MPNIARFSWQTVKTLLEKHAHKVKWADEPATIQRYFHPGSNGDGDLDAGRPALLKELDLVSVAEV
jgi:ribonuclease H2 subunit A